MRSSALRTALTFSAIVLFAVYVYWDILSYRTFGNEFPSFYVFFAGHTFSQTLQGYTHLNYPWYRPTTFDLFYWFGSLLVDWHNVMGWKILELGTALLCGFLIYWLVLLLLPNQRLAAALAAIYYIASPNLYSVVLEMQGGDFLHIVFCMLCVILFLLASRSTGRRAAALTFLSFLSYAMALSAKELTIVTPVYLTVLGIVLLFTEGDKTRWRRTALQLLPFFLLTGAYWLGHVQRIPKNYWVPNGGYRTSFYLPAVIENLMNYPFWMARIYGLVPDSKAMMAHHANWWTNAPACLATLAVLVVWTRKTLKDASLRAPLLLLLAWMGIFVMVPVYSGGYFWHANLAMAGYAVLFGYTIATLIQSIPAEFWRRAAVFTFVLGFLFLARANAWSLLTVPRLIPYYRLDYTALDQPPIKPGQLKGPGRPLVYIEDRLNLSPWAYGGGDALFKFIYLNKDIEEKSVPAMNSVSKPLCTEWLARPNAHFFYYDARYRWKDGTDLFREYCKGKV